MKPDLDTPVLTYKAPRKPSLRLPPGACDAHVHVWGPAARFPFWSGRSFTPVDTPKEALFALHRTLGIQRCVIVQSQVHGTDNRAVEDAIAAGGGRYLGIAVVPVDVADGELERLARAGFRGVRINFMPHLGQAPDLSAVVRLTQRLAPLCMHLQVNFPSSLIHELAGPLASSAVPVVIDHMARLSAPISPDHPDLVALLALMRNPLFRIKVSGADRAQEAADADGRYRAGASLARLLVERFPEQCLWGTDWPHPNHTHVPDDAGLVETLADIAPTPELLQRLLVTNPHEFYRFEA